MFLKWIKGSEMRGMMKHAHLVACIQGRRTLLIQQATGQVLSGSAARATGERLKLTACRCKRLRSRFSMLPLHPGSLLQLQTRIDCGGQRLCLSLRGFGRKVCDAFSSHNRFSWYSQPASLLSCILTCIGMSLALGAFSEFFLQLCFSLPLVGHHSPPPLCRELCLLQSGPCLIKGDSFPVVTLKLQ